jgi:hypothetical protein
MATCMYLNVKPYANVMVLGTVMPASADVGLNLPQEI